jgi:DNA polymerase sigma
MSSEVSRGGGDAGDRSGARSSSSRGNGSGAGRGGSNVNNGTSNNNSMARGGRNSRRGPGKQKSRAGSDQSTPLNGPPTIRDEVRHDHRITEAALNDFLLLTAILRSRIRNFYFIFRKDILIAFMPFLKSSNIEATRIHEEYQSSHDQRSFLKAARVFLEQEKMQPPATEAVSITSAPSSNPINSTNPITRSTDGLVEQNPKPRGPPEVTRAHQQLSSQFLNQSPNEQFVFSNAETYRSDDTIPSAENGLRALLLHEDDPIVSMAFPGNAGAGSIWASATVPSPITPPRLGAESKVTSSPWREIENTSQPAVPDNLFASPSPNRTTVDAAAASSKKDTHSAKRLLTHFSEQPGRIWVNDVSGEDHSVILPVGPRDELTAKWTLPMDYVNQYRGENGEPSDESLDRLLAGLTVGLFRRGCTENGQQASIISKEVPWFNRRYDAQSNTITGIVPFFSPRTPGNVLFRMYWETDPIHTLAIGPTLHVRIVEQEFESSIRFILSNFKGRKSNPTSLSSLHSLATVLETPLSRRHEATMTRSVWGCVQEARKVVEACYQEYVKTCGRMVQLETKVEELKRQLEDEGTKPSEIAADRGDLANEPTIEPGKSETELALNDKTRTLLGGRASCERKWRDSQLAFAGILKAVLTNSSLGSLLRRDLLSRMRIEYELWCPLSEEFAVPNESAETWFECTEELPQSITADHFKSFQQARIKMQLRTLGFDINTMSLQDVLFPSNHSEAGQRSMDPGAVSVFNNLSGAMGQYYQELFIDEEQVVRKRELIRQRTERNVQECGAFPPGTEVVIFGSSANGFGSPESDLDMCLHLPIGAKLNDNDRTGAESMAALADAFKATGMIDVDTARLSARIPIIMYKCPNPLAGGDSEDDLLECDLSMHNPLAVLNTSLLRSYAEITPVTRVLAAVIKRWAKARDINSPARHTLSSYGYIIMLLHFLTYHKRTGNGLVSPVAEPEGEPELRNTKNPQAIPILPNLQWIDQSCIDTPTGTPYCNLSSLPKSMMKHPMKDTFVNTHFYKPSTAKEKAFLQTQFAGEDLSLAILLASFFRYYAYEFDYKRHVVSLHSTGSRGIVEREVKAELDGWRNYSAALAIEDPFELDYDIAHVLRGGYYHRIRREFAMAYTKIADAASGRPNSWNKGDLRTITGNELIDWICERVSTEREQV